MVRNAEFTNFEGSDRVVGQIIEGEGSLANLHRVIDVADAQPELPAHCELLVEDDANDVGTDDGGLFDLRGVSGDGNCCDLGGDCEYEVA